MEKNRELFQSGEANEWFKRNQHSLEEQGCDPAIALLADWLRPFANDISNVLEIGCGSGHRLNQISTELDAIGFGVEPSSEAVEYIGTKFPNLEAKVGFGDDVPFSGLFELVHLGFFLYLVDRKWYLRCISEADKFVKEGKFLSIIDFEPPSPYSNTYSHTEGAFSHKHNNSDVFVASGLYSVVNKFHYSHSNFFFDVDTNMRVSLTLLYKETNVFGTSIPSAKNS